MKYVNNIDDHNVAAFLALVRAGLWEKDVELQKYGTTDFGEVMRLAEEQSVVGLVTAGLEHVTDVKVPQEWLLQFIGLSLQIEQQNTSMNKFIGELMSKLQKVDIYAVLVKGQGIAQCYEKPLWRASGDVDLLLSDDNYDKADAFLTSIATAVDTDRGKHHGMTIGEWEVELQGHLNCGFSKRMDQVIQEAQRSVFYDGCVRSWQNDNTQIFLPNENNDVIFIFTHFLKHFYKGGLGLRQICDWSRLLLTYRETLDSKLLESRLRRAGIMSQWRAFGAFAIDYLGLPIEALPLYSSDKKWKRKAVRICSFVMMSGNMGHNRDLSYFNKYPYIIRKMCSFRYRLGDLCRHARIFPLDSFRFSFNIIFGGIKSAIKGY